MRRTVAYGLSLLILAVSALPVVWAQVVPGSPFSAGGGGSGLTNIATGTNSFSLAPALATSSNTSVSLGALANASGSGGTAVGKSATATAANSTAYGELADATGTNSTAIGQDANATGATSVVIGKGSTASGASAYVIGVGSTSANNITFVVGETASSTAAGQIVFGSPTVPFTDLHLGEGVRGSGAIADFTIHTAAGANSADQAGGSLILRPGESTGTGAGGNLTFDRVPTTNTTGSTLNVAVTAQKIVSKARSIADNTATTLFVVAGLGAHTFASGQVLFSAFATNATDDQTVSGIIRWSGVDTTAGAGGETCAAAVVGTVDAQATNGGAASAGTLACTAGATTGTDLCNIQVTCDSSLDVTQPVYYQVFANCATCTITPQ